MNQWSIAQGDADAPPSSTSPWGSLEDFWALTPGSGGNLGDG